jgi:mannose-6-phosphate isomerase-like protein (cupin superfamily)
VKTLLFAAAAASAALGAAAQAPAPAASGEVPREPPSNFQTGVAIDRYIGDASRNPPTVSLDVMLTRPILTAGDPQKPGAPGAVLLYRKEIALDTLQPGETTSLGRSADQMIFYVEQGEGRLDDGKSYWPIKPGVMMLAPPGVGYRFAATGDKPLKMLSVDIPVEPGVKPKTEMIVRDVAKMALTERNVHWSNMTKYVFVGERDGLFPSDRVYIVYMAPMTLAGPHAHSPGQEEVWIKASEGRSIMQLGSEIRPWPMNAGFVAPPNGRTVHAAYNLDDHVQAWFYIARLNPNPSAAPRRPANRPPPPPAIAEGLAASNIAPTPLPTRGSPRR